MNLGDNLRELLELNNITQKELAEKLAFAPSTLGNYIQGTREPDYNTLLIIADFYLFRSLTSEQQEFYLVKF